MRSSVYKRAASLLICVAFLLSVTFVKPQKADAIAITGTAAVVASVAAIMTACGVTYWAASEQDAIDYLGGKIEDYLTAAGSTASNAMEWLGIDSMSDLFMVIQGGALSFPRIITNKILDFIRWFNQEEGVTSGGQPVGELGDLNAISIPVYTSTGTTEFYNDSVGVAYDSSGQWRAGTSYSYPIYSFAVDLGQNDYTIYFVSNNNRPKVTLRFYTSSSSYSGTENIDIATRTGLSGLYYGFKNVSSVSSLAPLFSTSSDGFVYVQGILNGTVSAEDIAIVTPSASVSVPSDIEVGQSLVVTTTAPINSEDDVEAASEAILGEIASQDGLDATNATDGEAVPSAWTWLYNVVRGLADTVENIFDSILDLPVTIANAIKAALLDLFVPDEAFIDAYVATLYANFDNHFSILSYPFSLLGTFITKVATAGSSEPIISWPNIYEYFSGKLLIAAGSYNLNSILANQAIANMYAIYMIVVKAIISFQFVAFLYAWFCDVFHMRNSDFDNPYDLASGGDIDDS